MRALKIFSAIAVCLVYLILVEGATHVKIVPVIDAFIVLISTIGGLIALAWSIEKIGQWEPSPSIVTHETDPLEQAPDRIHHLGR